MRRTASGSCRRRSSPGTSRAGTRGRRLTRSFEYCTYSVDCRSTLNRPVVLELALDQRVLVGRRRAVVVGVVLQLEVDRGADAGAARRSWPCRRRGAVAVAVEALERLVRPVRPSGPGRRAGCRCPCRPASTAPCGRRGRPRPGGRRAPWRVGVGGLRAERHRVEVEDHVADLAAGAVDDLDLVVGAQVGDVVGRQAAERDVESSCC